jgi:hypothetical protein
MDIQCASCETVNPHGANFCSGCGGALQSAASCGSCGAQVADGAGFCSHCGAKQAKDEVPAGPGYVVDGAWHKAPGEFVRRVRIGEMRSAYQKLVPGLDLDGFFKGTLVGQVLDKLQAKSIKVPAGAVGVIVLDGKVRQVLPPGEQTTVGWLKELVRLAEGDLKGAGAAVLDRLTESDRLSFYLLDRRPVPMAFGVDVPGHSGMVHVQVQSLATVGGSEQALGAFLDSVMRDADTLTAQDLYTQFRGDVQRVGADLIHAHAPDWGKAERALTAALRERFNRNGLRFEVLVAPRDTLFRMECTLGMAATPKVRTCGSCSTTVPHGMAFCTSCGARQEPTPEVADTDSLVTSDHQVVELQVVLAVQGRGELKDAGPVERALAGAVARRVREHTLEQLNGMLEVLGEQLGGEVTDALAALGWRLAGLQVLDVRSRNGEWARGARADMERARQEAALGREWLQADELALQTQALTLTHVLKREQMELDQAFARRQASLADAQRHAGLASGERSLQRDERTEAHTDALTGEQRRQELDRARRDDESARKRQAADDASYADKKRREARLEELERLAALDERLSDQEHKQLKELTEGRDAAGIIAVQAGKLAGQEGGGEFAKALASMAEGQARQEVVEAYKDAAKMAQSMAEKTMEANARVAAAKAGSSRANCGNCGVELKPGADFCGECGTKV